MKSSFICACMAAFITIALVTGTVAHAGRASREGDQVKKKNAQSQQERRSEQQDAQSEDRQDAEAIKLGTTLVTVPVIASDRSGVYVPDMKRDEFKVYEEGIEQEVVFFATVEEPFHVVLMLDTSASTQEQLGQIQRAAIAFVEQLHEADRVKAISFDDQVYDLCEFTSDRAALRQAIQRTRAGQGTKLYDAVQLALGSLRPIQGRKAIVIFTDGVDYRSDRAKYEDNTKSVEESGVIVYPIRYDTREATERLVRGQQSGGRSADLGVILGGPPIGTTPPTVPGGSTPIPRGPTGGQRDPLGLPIPPINFPRPRTDRYPDNRYPDNRYPDNRNPDRRFPDPRYPDDRFPDSRNDPYPMPRDRREDTTDVMLDSLYRTADEYLNDLATMSGGKLHRADTLMSLPAAFAQIAGELRTQYSLGYYPSGGASDGEYRRIRVTSTRKNVVVRARPGYRASSK